MGKYYALLQFAWQASTLAVCTELEPLTHSVYSSAHTINNQNASDGAGGVHHGVESLAYFLPGNRIQEEDLQNNDPLDAGPVYKKTPHRHHCP